MTRKSYLQRKDQFRSTCNLVTRVKCGKPKVLLFLLSKQRRKLIKLRKNRPALSDAKNEAVKTGEKTEKILLKRFLFKTSKGGKEKKNSDKWCPVNFKSLITNC